MQNEAMPKTELVTPFGAKATIYHQGAHVTSWIPSAAYGEQLFVARYSEYAAGKAIRGGVPVCFPQFAAFGTGVKHGFARNMDWRLSSINEDQTEAVLTLSDSDKTRKLWPHSFELTLTVTLAPEKITMAMTVTNTGASAFDFSGALHTYFGVSQFTQVELSDMTGITYWDNGTDFSNKKVDCNSVLALSGALDRVYFDAPNSLKLLDGDITKTIVKRGFTDVVVWNPGPEGAKGLSDMGDDEFNTMLCVEAAVVDRPISLSAGASWTGVQEVVVSRG
ncbi:MAG TPA: D-hexose-6-phosphate mutarotase [Marinagarivorans sp.]